VIADTLHYVPFAVATNWTGYPSHIQKVTALFTIQFGAWFWTFGRRIKSDISSENTNKAIFRSRSCKCGHGLDSHSETGRCTSYIGFADAFPCSSYLNAPVNPFILDSK